MHRKMPGIYLPFLALSAIVVYGVLTLAGFSGLAEKIILILLILGSIPLVWNMVGQIFEKHFGVDVIAIIAIIASIILGQYLAGIVILLMLSGGDALEDYAFRRARKELTALLKRAPTIAHLKTGSTVSDISIGQVAKGDVLVVKPGEIIPTDGNVIAGSSMIDESAITGESLPMEVKISSQVLSGTLNTSDVLEIRVAKESKDSKYQQLIRLVKQAEERKAPIVRLADRYTVVFTAITFIFAMIAWFLSKDPVRVLAVLVVATPCPLILATPIAIISGMNKSAKRGIIVKDGVALEQLGEAKAFVFDKTGTITLGTPQLVGVRVLEGDEHSVLSKAASLDQLSTHILARSLLNYAREKNLVLNYPSEYRESFGEGVSGHIGQKYYFGKLSFIKKQGIEVSVKMQEEHDQLRQSGRIAVYLADQRHLVGMVFFADLIRPESKQVFQNLIDRGASRIIMLTGDRAEVAEHISQQIGVKEVYAESLPEQKLEIIKKLQTGGIKPVVMVGDGVNDAAALAAADVGIAMGAYGASASSEAGGIVVAVDDLSRVDEAYEIAQKAVRIALQGIFIGMSLSIGLMVLAVLGLIQPVPGALLQEIIDVLVIFNALRVLL